MNRVLKITMLFGLAAAATPLAFAGGPPQPQHPDSEGVKQAIRFERAKDAADARQARLEAAREGKGEDLTSTTAANDGAVSGDGGVQAAIRFERAKDAADARQSRREANHPSEAANTTAMAGRHLATTSRGVRK